MYFKYLVGTWACAVVKYAGHVSTRYTTVRIYELFYSSVVSEWYCVRLYSTLRTLRDIVPRVL